MAAYPSSSNEDILEHLSHGIAQFEISSSPVLPVSSHCYRNLSSPFAPLATSRHLFFARLGPSLSASKKSEHYTVRKVTGDGRCLFRALVKGMAINKGMVLGPREEREGADELRIAVKEVICDNNERNRYEDAIIAITVEEPLRRYCQRIGKADFWGGEAELLVLSRLCSQPIVVYIPENEHAGWGSGFIPIQEYGSEFRKSSGKKNPRDVVRLLYSGRNHYDLLV